MKPSILKTALAALLLCAATASAQTKLLRFPAIHGDRIAFTYAGDLWTVPTTGGTAIRLTAHPGLELFAHFSPDGQQIAFTGQYDGDEQVYVVPSGGGVPKQLTYYPANGPLAERWGYDNQVYGWTPDGKRILFRSWRDSWTLPIAHLYTVAANGGAAVALPLPTAGSGSYSADGKSIVYSPVFRDFRSEKRYSGGEANSLVIFDLARNTAVKIPHKERAQRDEMWIGDVVYYNSDEDGTFNLYAYDIKSGAITQITHSKQWDVRWPSADAAAGKIIFEQGFTLHVLDTKTNQVTDLNIFVPSDELYSRPSHVAAANNIENYDLSPKGERAVFAARGDIFTAPIEKGPTRNLTNTSGAHDKAPAWSPDGRKIVFLSDRSGEEELWLAAQDGSSAPEQLTHDGHAMRYSPTWSPDGSRIAFADKDGKLYVLTVGDRKISEIADDPRGTINDYAWSPRGNLLAFSMNDARGISALYVWDGSLHKVTDGFFGEGNPAWDPNGDYLYYTSQREYAPQLSNIEWNFAGNRNTRIYALALRKDVKNPFPAESDEVKPADTTVTATTAAKEAGSAGAKQRSNEETKQRSGALAIDYDGISARVTAVPLDADNYFGLSANKGNLIYAVGSAGYYGRASEKPASLRIYSLADRKETVLADKTSGFALSADGNKLLVRDGNSFNLIDAKAGGAKKPVATSGLYVNRVPSEEWTQIFDEVWRRYRDFFYASNMHGNDWDALKAQYRPLLQYVQHRSDLNYLISEMISELSVQHAYIAGGDWDIPARPQVALPGARFELDPASNKYRITKIFEGENEEPIYRSPLREVGVDASVGDYIQAIDGEPLRADQDPYALLRWKADRPVRLTLSKDAAGTASHDVTYRPITREGDLVYLDWTTRNRRMVDELSGGKVGYIHVPDMGAAGIREFIKWYYPQVRKEGLVIDVRANGGGNVSSMLIDRLRRELLATGFSRTDDYASTYPRGAVFYGSMATILDENSASDGDIFPAMFKQAKLGPLIGKRSWGGVEGITDHGPLIDGGSVNVPEFGFTDVNGNWIIEGHGVDPDIVVEQDPTQVMQGKDPQLERAVQEVMKMMAANPKHMPKRAALPVKVKPR